MKTHTAALKKFPHGESIFNIEVVLILYYLTEN